MSTISSLGSYLHSVLGTALQSTGLTTKTAGNNLNGTTSIAQKPDNSQLSPFGQLLTTLQQLQQSDPTKYQQVTQQISLNLQNAAKTAQADGNAAAANQLNQLATDFNKASTSGQIPDIKDLAQAMRGHHHGHHHMHPASTDADASATSTSSSNTSQSVNPLLAAFQSNGTQNDALNPTAIILNTLSSSGINISNS